MLDQHPGADRELTLGQPAHGRGDLADGSRWRVGGGDQVTPGDVDVGVQPQNHRLTRDRDLQRTVGGVDGFHPRVRPAGQHDDLLADPHLAGSDLTGIAAVVGGEARCPRGPGGERGRLRPDDLLHREPELGERGQRRRVDGLQVAEHGRPVVPGHPGRADGHVVTFGRGHRDAVGVRHVQAPGQPGELGRDRDEPLLGVVDQVDLVDHQDDVRDPQQRGHREVATRLLDDAVARVDQQHDHVSGRRPGDRVTRVLHVPGAVGQDELPRRGGEVAVGDVDGDALLPLGPQPVGQQREVGLVQPLALAHLLHVVEGVGQHRVRVVQQPTHQRRLAVVHRPGRGQSQDRPAAGLGRRLRAGCHQK